MPVASPVPEKRSKGPSGRRSWASAFSSKKARTAFSLSSTPSTGCPRSCSQSMSSDFPASGTNTGVPGARSSAGQCSTSRRLGRS